MKKTLLLLVIILFSVKIFSQKNIPYKQTIQFGLGSSHHGSGDISGIMIDFSHVYYLKRRISLSNTLSSTIHWGKDKQFNTLFPGISPQARALTFYYSWVSAQSCN